MQDSHQALAAVQELSLGRKAGPEGAVEIEPNQALEMLWLSKKIS